MTTARPGVPDVEPADPTTGEQDVRISRRRWVRDAVIGGTVVAAGAGLAACSSASPQSAGPASGATGTATPSTTQSGGGAAGPTSAATTGAATTDDKGGGGSGNDDTTTEQFRSIHLGKTSSIPVGGGVVYHSQGVVVTQPTAGTFKCFSASCTHLGCLVNKVAAGLIQCPCHGARFSIVDGSVKAGPAPRGLTQQGFSVQNGVVELD